MMVILAQSDTTAGFFSNFPAKLNKIKKRPKNKPVLAICKNLKTLKNFVRIPNAHKNFVRKAKKTTFIYPNSKSFRLTTAPHCVELIDKFGKNGMLYSTSANLHKEKFNLQTATFLADTTIQTPKLKESTPSVIYKLTKYKKIKIR